MGLYFYRLFFGGLFTGTLLSGEFTGKKMMLIFFEFLSGIKISCKKLKGCEGDFKL